MANRNAAIKEIETAINVDEIFDDIIDAIKKNHDPEDVFDVDQLETWAENNGYTKED